MDYVLAHETENRKLEAKVEELEMALTKAKVGRRTNYQSGPFAFTECLTGPSALLRGPEG